ncbi:MAG: protein-methionine-sulfoxide reductase heme-binding subunit MsrQ [Pseudomonadota bacterium]|jgi:sulfoxide reductase heme-binding subunit YedZ
MATATPIERRYRWLYKPLLHIACLVPFAWCVGGALGLPHVPGLGVEPARKVLGILGHTGLNLLLCTLAITPLRQLTGNPHLLRLRRTLGVYAFVYVLLHFNDYMGIQGFSLHAIFADIAKRPYITLGFTALVLLVPMAITSTNGMIRRLRTRWRTIHKLVYPVAVLGVWHYWWQVKKDIREPLLYAAILAALLGWRIVRHQLLHRRAGLPQLGKEPQP